MAIDPDRLSAQRLSLVPREEKHCDRCGKRTTDRTGTCAPCKRASIPKLELLSTEALVGIVGRCRDELERRRQEVEAALRGTR